MKISLSIALFLSTIIGLCNCSAQHGADKADTTEIQAVEEVNELKQNNMKIEIWSDIMCPFCYIGKRHFEEALKDFGDVKNLEIEWKSFQLDPTIPRPFTENKSMYQYLADSKGWSLEQSKELHQNVVKMAEAAGLKYDFDQAVVANSWDAHRVIQLAKKQGLGDAIEERFFKAYFSEGQDMADKATLIRLASEIGIDKTRVEQVLNSEEYADEVKADIARARNIGVTGVPFFVFDNKYGVSGAQPAGVFKETLDKSFAEWRKNNPEEKLQVLDGPSCTPDGECK